MKYLFLILLFGCSVMENHFNRYKRNWDITYDEFLIWHKDKVIEHSESTDKELEWYTDRIYTNGKY